MLGLSFFFILDGKTIFYTYYRKTTGGTIINIATSLDAIESLMIFFLQFYIFKAIPFWLPAWRPSSQLIWRFKRGSILAWEQWT